MLFLCANSEKMKSGVPKFFNIFLLKFSLYFNFILLNLNKFITFALLIKHKEQWISKTQFCNCLKR
nr:MAG TPA: hypothetical protein [Caudoviricetes sp.]